MAIAKDKKMRRIEKVFEGMTEHKMSCYKSCVYAEINMSTFLHWVAKDPVLVERYKLARDNLIEKMAEEIIDIADEDIQQDERGKIDNAVVNKKRLQIDSRKWLLAKMAPQKYGERIAIAGDSESVPVRIESAIDVTKLSDDVLAAIIAAKKDGNN